MKLILSQEGIKKIERIDDLSKMLLIYGVVDETTRTNGVLVKDYAIYVEYGTIHIPERPFFRTMQIKNADIMKRVIKKILSNCIEGYIEPIDAFKRIGRYIKSKLEDSLLNGNWEPNSPETIKYKKGDKPLVDTGNLLNSLGFVIYKNKNEIYRGVGR